MAGPEGLEEKLRKLLSLNAYEARVYITLLSNGPLKPREAARAAGVPPQRVYDVLDSLFRRGLVVKTADGRFDAVDPRTALPRLAEQALEEARRRAEGIARLAEELAGLRGSRNLGDVYLVSGLWSAVGEALEAARGCGGPLYFMVYKVALEAERLRNMVEVILDAVRGRARILIPRGVSVPRWALAVLGEAGVEVRASEASILDMMVACDTVIMGLPGGMEDVVAVVIANREFAGALRERLMEVWERAEPLVLDESRPVDEAG